MIVTGQLPLNCYFLNFGTDRILGYDVSEITDNPGTTSQTQVWFFKWKPKS